MSDWNDAVKAERDARRHAEEMHQRERDVLFENETLAVKVLQAVSGAAMIGALAQADTIIRLAGPTPFLAFLTAMGVALLAAVFAAHWKHQYKLYDVKSRVADEVEMHRRGRISIRYLIGMRAAMWVSIIAIALGFLQLLGAFWLIAMQH